VTISVAPELQSELITDPYLERPFVFWDGETPQDSGYSLFGNSAGYEILHRDISTLECLELILRCGREMPDAIHVGFAFDYDVNMILKDIGWTRLNNLHQTNGCDWRGFHIEHIPRKWFLISKDSERVKIYDVFSFFNTRYISALNQYAIGNQAQRSYIELGKDKRATFKYKDMGYIRRYWAAEVGLGPPLMDELRTRFRDAGYPINSWHGPGALARLAIRQQGVREWMATTPPPVWLAARHAYTGGRFQQFLAGYHDGPVWSADLNSAYPYGCSMLPNLATGRWQYYQNRIPPKRFEFALYHIRYRMHRKQGVLNGPHPLFFRREDGRIDWPCNTESWYWGPEAWNVRNDPHAEFLEAWVFEDDGTRPFTWINEAYQKRMFLKSINHPAELGVKLMLNAMTGQFAQRVGWEKDGKPPANHQLEWAGFITSTCKSLVWEAAKEIWERDGLISIDTDAVFSRVPFVDTDLPGGKSETGLGQWGLSEYTGILSWQNGVYWLRNSEREWTKQKSRGAPRGRIDIQDAWRALRKWEPITYKSTRFIRYGQALQEQFSKWRSWQEQDTELIFGGDPQGKMYHALEEDSVAWQFCRKCRGKTKKQLYTAGMHDLIPSFDPGMGNVMSEMHRLPWVDDKPLGENDWDYIFDLDISEEDL
jgi:hypothetical protein